MQTKGGLWTAPGPHPIFSVYKSTEKVLRTINWIGFTAKATHSTRKQPLIIVQTLNWTKPGRVKSSEDSLPNLGLKLELFTRRGWRNPVVHQIKAVELYRSVILFIANIWSLHQCYYLNIAFGWVNIPCFYSVSAWYLDNKAVKSTNLTFQSFAKKVSTCYM